ncbi:MAG: hypothetical protein ACK46X_18960 [Candidatus Sericytochromatia bacterium]
MTNRITATDAPKGDLKRPASTKSRGNYGTQAQYVSRAFALYEQFKKSDH